MLKQKRSAGSTVSAYVVGIATKKIEFDRSESGDVEAVLKPTATLSPHHCVKVLLHIEHICMFVFMYA